MVLYHIALFSILLCCIVLLLYRSVLHHVVLLWKLIALVLWVPLLRLVVIVSYCIVLYRIVHRIVLYCGTIGLYRITIVLYHHGWLSGCLCTWSLSLTLALSRSLSLTLSRSLFLCVHLVLYCITIVLYRYCIVSFCC